MILNLKQNNQIKKIYNSYTAAIFDNACFGRMTSEWRIKHTKIESATNRWKIDEKPIIDINLPSIPNSWCYRTLKEISYRVSVGHVGPTSQFYCKSEVGIPFIRSQNVRPRKLDFSGLNYITKQFHEKLKKSQLKSGDLLVVRVGANRGDTCIVPDNMGSINCANIVFARPFEGISDF